MTLLCFNVFSQDTNEIASLKFDIHWESKGNFSTEKDTIEFIFQEDSITVKSASYNFKLIKEDAVYRNGNDIWMYFRNSQRISFRRLNNCQTELVCYWRDRF
jgi:hypothetical protein